MTEETQLLVTAVLWSAVVPSALMALAVLLCRKGPISLREAGYPLGLAVALGHVAFQIGTGWQPVWPPREVLHWLPLAALLAAGIGVLPEAPSTALGRLRQLSHLGLFVAVSWILVRPLALRSWSFTTGAMVLCGLMVLAALVWLGLERAGSKSPTPFASVAVLIAATAGSGIAVLSHSARVGQLFGSLAAPFGVLAFFTLFGLRLRSDRGAASVATVLALGLLINLQVYVQVSWHVVGLLVLSLLSPHLLQLSFLALFGQKKQWCVALLGAALPAGTALVLVWLGAEPANDYYY